jgi:hypothetical protein
MANTIGEKELKTDWPKTTGLVAGTTKQKGKTINLLPQEKTMIASSKRTGIYQ